MKNYSRRKFLQTSMIGAAGLSMFPLLQGCSSAPSDQIRLGVIGLGRQALSLTNGFYQNPGIKIVAGSDVYGRKRERYEMIVRNHQEETGQSAEISTTDNYREVIEREDIDVIVIATPDHWHAIQAIEACKAGKDVYLEKPVTYSIQEGIELVKTVRENDTVLGVGSQQRSDPNFQHAVRLIQENRLGDLTKVNAWSGAPAIPYNLPEEQVPEDMDWDKWLGPIPYIHYNPELNPPISLDPVQNEQFWGGWRWYRHTGGGYITDWGAHMFDIAQWALGRQYGGPVEVIPAGHSGTEYIDFVYDDGLVMSNAPFTENETFGVRFESDSAWIEVHRGEFRASDDSLLPPVPEADAAVEEYETASPHLVNFINSVKSREDPIANIEAGHRTNTVGVLGNIATQLNRPLKWNPDLERFVDDSEADMHLHREYREGYNL